MTSYTKRIPGWIFLCAADQAELLHMTPLEFLGYCATLDTRVVRHHYCLRCIGWDCESDPFAYVMALAARSRANGLK